MVALEPSSIDRARTVWSAECSNRKLSDTFRDAHNPTDQMHCACGWPLTGVGAEAEKNLGVSIGDQSSLYLSWAFVHSQVAIGVEEGRKKLYKKVAKSALLNGFLAAVVLYIAFDLSLDLVGKYSGFVALLAAMTVGAGGSLGALFLTRLSADIWALRTLRLKKFWRMYQQGDSAETFLEGGKK